MFAIAEMASSEHPAGHDGRQGLSELLVQLACTRRDERVDELIGNGAGLALELCRATAGEQRVQQPPIREELGRIDAQRDALGQLSHEFAVDLLQGEIMERDVGESAAEAAREVLVVLEHPDNVTVPRQEP
jgi:hypothetical protein